MKQILILLLVLHFFAGQAQSNQKFNLGFEASQKENKLSDGWFEWGNYELANDKISHSGKWSGKVTSDEAGSSFGSIAYRIPANYEGDNIRLEGFMKIKNVEKGFAGLLLRIDGVSGSLAFDNMQKQNITGTKDWQQYSVTLNYPEGATNIFIAGILTGKGEAWFDDLVLTIDGKDVQTLQEKPKKIYKAQLDKAFDNGSSIDFPALTPSIINNLELLGRVWGFIKYHHPEIGQGNYNWDYELFRFLPKYLAVKTEEARNNLLIEWIDSLGEIGICFVCQPTNKNAFLKPNLKWIEAQEGLLKKKLLAIYKNRHQGIHYYIKMANGIGNPVFLNEKAYAKMSFPDDGFRLLSLYRYWNMIHYYFPYKHLMDKDWNVALKEYLPKFINAKDELAYEFAALQLIGDIQDTHANIGLSANKVNEWKGVNFPPVRLQFIENELVVTSFHNSKLKDQTGLEIGDLIKTINGSSIKEIIEEKLKYYPASNLPTQLRNLSQDLLRSNSKEVEITFLSANHQTLRTKKLILYPRDSLNIRHWSMKSDDKSYKMLDNNIGYITLQSIKEEDIPAIRKAFKDTKGIIIDIRNYPAAFVPFKLGSYFVSSSAPFVKFSQGNTNNPGEFTFTENLEIKSAEKPYEGKVMVLVNEFSQSQAEYTAMAFKAGINTTIIGSTTAGADGNVSSILLPGGLRTMISGIGVYYPNGQETQRVGIIPDLEVRPTVKGIRAGRDELLEKAVELILDK